jgi:hypothetical protein
MLTALVLLAIAGACDAQERGPMRNGLNLLDLVEWQEVRDELRTTADQNAKLHEIYTDIHGRRANRPKADSTTGDQTSRLQKWREESAALKQEISTRLADVLDVQQLQRLRELYAQRYSALALLRDEDFAATLKLSDEQRRQRLRLRRKATKPTQDGTAAAKEQARRDNEEKAVAILTDEQKAALAEIRGAAFQFAAVRSP